MIGKRLGKERQEAKERLITRERSEPPLIHPSLPPSHLPPLYILQDSLRPLFCVAHWRCHLRHGRPRAARAGPSRRRAGAEAAAATPAGHRRAGRWSRTLGFVTTLVQESATLRMLINSQKKRHCRKLKLETFVSWNILYS